MPRHSSQRSVLSVIGVLLSVLAVLAIAPAVARAQPFSSAQPGIVAIGFGAASAPAASADLQILLSAGGFGEFGPVMPRVEGTPTGDVPPEAIMVGPSQLTAEQLAPVVDDRVAAGASDDAITVTVPAAAYSAIFGPGGPESGEIRAEIPQPTSDQLNQLVEGATTAANDAGLTLLHVGARFEASDCPSLVQAARVAAVADAQERAEGLAQAVGASLGELVQASESPFFGPEGGGSCGVEGPPDAFFGPFGPATVPPFDPSAPAEASAYIQITLTYAFGTAPDATPSP
ncbi:MAG: SIMPL domain-containing protein [Thermomicrobiales bacterium]